MFWRCTSGLLQPNMPPQARPRTRLDPYGFKPSYEFSPLSSLSAIFRLARYTRRPAKARQSRSSIVGTRKGHRGS